MAEAGRDLTDTLFGATTATAAPVDQWRQTLRLDDLEQQYNLPAGLMTSVLRQESGGDPRVKSSAGAQGIFQFMPKTAAAYKIDPFDPQQAAPAAAKELSTLYKKYGGDVDRTLAAWNWGQGNVDRKGMTNMPTETRGFLTNVKRFLSPGVAEAASPTAPSGGRDLLAPVQSSGSGGGRDLTDMLFGATPPETSPQATTSTQVPGTATQAASTPQTEPGASQGPAMRLSLGDPTQAATEPEARATIEAMRQRQSAQQLAPLAIGGGPAETPQPVTDPAALLAVGGKPTQTREQEILAEARARPRTPVVPLRPGVPTIEQETLQEGITKPSTMIPLLMPGAGAKAGLRLVPEAWRWVGRIGGEALTQTAAELGGKALETGQAPSFKDIATTTAWNLAPQAGEELLRAVPRAVLRSGQGARTIISDVAAQESKGLGKRVFHPQDEQVLSKMFEDVKASGVKLDIDPVTDLFTSLQPSQRQVLLRDVKTISSPLAAALQRTGTPGAPRLAGWDIGDLQTLRSELLKRSHVVRTPERQDLITEMRMAVDDAISNGMAVGHTAAGGNPETLKAAQAGWRRLKQSDDLQALVTKHTSFSPNLRYQDLNLAALRKSLEGTNPLGRKVAASLGDTETAALQQELTTLAKRYPFVKIPSTVLNITGGAGLPAAGYQLLQGNVPGAAATASAAVMALALQSPRAMEVFRSAIVNGKGRLSSNDIAAIVNAVRQVSDVEEPSGTPR